MLNAFQEKEILKTELGTKPILAVDTDLENHEYRTIKWGKYGINSMRVDTMYEAIATLVCNKTDFLFVSINEDSVPDFISELHIMRDITDAPIFVVTSSYTIDKKIAAMQHGADAYEPFSIYAQYDVLAALELLELHGGWARRKYNSLPILIGHDIILSQSRRTVFVKNVEVHLTKKEFDILQYLMLERGHVVEHVQLLKVIWGEEYNETDTDVLWRTVNRLRSKLSEVSSAASYIKIERGVGYQFLL